MTKFDFEAARARLRPFIAETPVTRNAETGLYFKWESHQPTHSFKVRGAFNKMRSMGSTPLVITGSAGNHGQAVALAAQQFGIRVRVFVPKAAPDVKVNRMRELGAEVERVPGLYGDAEAKAIRAARETGAPFISPYNDPDVIAGAGTIALELIEAIPTLGRILVPVGGGGLIAGMGLAAKGVNADIEVIGVLSEASPYLYEQFYRGNMEGVVELPTLTDGLAGAVEAGSITIGLITQAADAIIQVTEADVRRAVAHHYLIHGEVVEGSGAVGLAAVLAGKARTDDRVTATVVSGGNIDPARLEEVLRTI